LVPLNPPLFIVVPVSSQGREGSCIGVQEGIDIVSFYAVDI